MQAWLVDESSSGYLVCTERTVYGPIHAKYFSSYYRNFPARQPIFLDCYSAPQEETENHFFQHSVHLFCGGTW